MECTRACAVGGEGSAHVDVRFRSIHSVAALYISDLAEITERGMGFASEARMNDDPAMSAETGILPEDRDRPTDDPALPLKEACELFEREYVMRAVHEAEWNITGAARVLGVHRNTILKKLAAWGLQRPAADENQPVS
jgi:DNA-binding NtrC family response regulator